MASLIDTNGIAWIGTTYYNLKPYNSIGPVKKVQIYGTDKIYILTEGGELLLCIVKSNEISENPIKVILYDLEDIRDFVVTSERIWLLSTDGTLKFDENKKPKIFSVALPEKIISIESDPSDRESLIIIGSDGSVIFRDQERHTNIVTDKLIKGDVGHEIIALTKFFGGPNNYAALTSEGNILAAGKLYFIGRPLESTEKAIVVENLQNIVKIASYSEDDIYGKYSCVTLALNVDGNLFFAGTIESRMELFGITPDRINMYTVYKITRLDNNFGKVVAITSVAPLLLNDMGDVWLAKDHYGVFEQLKDIPPIRSLPNEVLSIIDGPQVKSARKR